MKLRPFRRVAPPKTGIVPQPEEASVRTLFWKRVSHEVLSTTHKLLVASQRGTWLCHPRDIEPEPIQILIVENFSVDITPTLESTYG